MTVKDGLILGRSILIRGTVSKDTSKHSTGKRPLQQCGKQFPQATLHAGFMGNNDTVLPDLSIGLKTSKIKNHG